MNTNYNSFKKVTLDLITSGELLQESQAQDSIKDSAAEELRIVRRANPGGQSKSADLL